jgi:hypothetical protein
MEHLSKLKHNKNYVILLISRVILFNMDINSNNSNVTSTTGGVVTPEGFNRDTKLLLQFGILEAYTELFSNNPALVTFDASPCDDEVAIVGLTVVDSAMGVHDHVGSLSMFSSPLNYKNWADIVLKSMECYKMTRVQIVFGNSDRGGPNKHVVEVLSAVWPNYKHLWCGPHSLQRVGRVDMMSCVSSQVPGMLS